MICVCIRVSYELFFINYSSLIKLSSLTDAASYVEDANDSDVNDCGDTVI